MAKSEYLWSFYLVIGLIHPVCAADVMSEDLLLGTSVGSSVTETESKAEDKSEKNSTVSKVTSFITKPLSLLFSANDEVETEEGKKETYLERATRQAEEGKIEDAKILIEKYNIPLEQACADLGISPDLLKEDIKQKSSIIRMY